MRGLLPRVELELASATFLQDAFGGALPELHLEIGFGGGEHLSHHARQRPRVGFIGCEPFRNGVAKMLDRIEAEELDNIRLFAGDAAALIGRLPDACLAGVDLFYPDPWPKRRQRKRRFVSSEMLRRLARVMSEGALLRFATDIDDYAGWTLARVMASDAFVWTAQAADDWLRPWPGWPSTRYEAKALREGRRPVYLTFRRTAAHPAPTATG